MTPNEIKYNLHYDDVRGENPLIKVGARAMTKFFSSKHSYSDLDLELWTPKVELARDIAMRKFFVVIIISINKCSAIEMTKWFFFQK